MIARRIALAFALSLAVESARAADPAPLQLERTISLPDVAGRIDHASIDLRRNRLFVAEFGNGTVDVVDLGTGKRVARIPGLLEPQGIAYVPASDRIVVASGGDGTARIFRAEDFAPAGVIDLGDDADNVRVDPRSGNVLIGHGDGGIAIVDPVPASRIADIEISAHPEGFQLQPGTQRIFVNLPDARRIGVLDLESRRQVASWTIPDLKSNFPLAVDEGGALLATVFRTPPRLALFDTNTGAIVASLDTCGDADDVFFDARRKRIYVSCGEGAVDTFQSDSASTRLLGRVTTPRGGRTSLFVPELDRLFVTVRAGAGSDASILVFRPLP